MGTAVSEQKVHSKNTVTHVIVFNTNNTNEQLQHTDGLQESQLTANMQTTR